MDLVNLFILILMWVVIVINLILILKNKVSGNLILLEEEGDKETYAFLELHEPIEKLKGKNSINLKIERRKPNPR